jgi:CRISPR-associated protein Cas6
MLLVNQATSLGIRHWRYSAQQHHSAKQWRSRDMPLDQTHSLCSTVEVTFPLHGGPLPAEHNAPLYAALCGLPELGAWFMETDDIAVTPVMEHAGGNGTPGLTTESRLLLRLPAAELPRVLGLSGRRLEVARQVLEIGHPRVALPQETATLGAELVVFDDGSAQDMGESGANQAAGAFIAEVCRQLAALEIAAEPVLGPAGRLHLQGRTLGGFALRIRDLAPGDSIHLQEAGLGDHRKLGCGVFVPG